MKKSFIKEYVGLVNMFADESFNFSEMINLNVKEDREVVLVEEIEQERVKLDLLFAKVRRYAEELKENITNNFDLLLAINSAIRKGRTCDDIIYALEILGIEFENEYK